MRYDSVFLYVIVTFIVYTVTFSTIIPDIDAQLLSGERRNNSDATTPAIGRNSSGNGLLSILRNPEGLGVNLSSVTDSMFQGTEQRFEEKINATMEQFKMKLDEIAAVAIPAIIAAVVGIIAFAGLIVVYIIISWFDRFKAIRRHKRALKNLYDLILEELKDNVKMVHQKSALTGSSDSLSNDKNNPVDMLATKQLSTQALEASTSSPLYLDMTSDIQHVIVKLLKALDGHNRVYEHALELMDSIVLNKVDKETADKILGRYESALTEHNHDINHLSKQLQELIQTETSKGHFDFLRDKHKDVVPKK